jgi:tetratricopeptide (TPR) repeat protein
LKPANLQTTRREANPQAAQAVWISIFLALAVFAVFGQTADFEFVNYDDDANVYDNPVVQGGLSFHAVGWAFTHPQGANWIPLTTLSHILDCQIFDLHAGGHHIVNVLFHAATVALLFLVLRRMTGSLWRSAFVAAVFAVHPLRAESVAWVTERKDVLSAFFFVLAIGAYVRYVENSKEESRKQKLFYALTLVCFVLGLLAKSMVATLPFVLLLLDYWPLGRMSGNQRSEGGGQRAEGGEEGTAGVPFWALVREKIPLFVLSAGFCAVAALVPGLLLPGAHRLPLFERIGNAAVSYAVYLGQMVFPAGLAIPYPNPPNGGPKWEVCMALALLGAISAGVMAWRKKRPFLLTGWLWYLGMLFPVLGIIQVSADASHADRYTYLPGIGLAMAVTWAAADWVPDWKHRRLALGGLMMAVVGTLAVFGHIQTSYWKNGETLWKHALACTAGNFVACNNLGTVFVHRGKPDDAIVEYRKCLEMAPYYETARNNLANSLATKGEDEEAVALYQEALGHQPDFFDAHFNLAALFVRHGRLEEAIAHYRKAVELKPDNEAALNNLGQALLLKGDSDGAMACLEKAVAMNPDPARRWHDLGNEFLQQGKFQPAIVFFRQAAKVNPRFADAWTDLGTACYKSGQPREAIDAWQKVLEINPDSLNVLNNLAFLLATASDPSLRNGSNAIALATKASQLSAGVNPVILRTLAAAQFSEGSNELAAATAQRALELAVEQKQDALAAALQQELKYYEAKTPPGNAPR